jgi:nucleoside-diphosphate-sugar epimerase
MSQTRYLVIGALGQIGSELTMELRRRHGDANVVASDIRSPQAGPLRDSGPFMLCDAVDEKAVHDIVALHNIDVIVHLAAILSARGEQDPALCWMVNMRGLRNVLEVAREAKLRQVFCPSSIAVFGPKTPRDNTPQETILEPTTMYGVTKVAGELLCDYYVAKFGMDLRGVRYPGIISAETLPGGGTTDYAVEIYYKAVSDGSYSCFLREDTMLPMMYMPDCIKATLDLMDAPADKLAHHSNFNIAAMSFTPADVAVEIKKHIPGFSISYAPDFHQAIADSWPRSIDDTAARAEWGWQPAYDLAAMTADMLRLLKARHEAGTLYPTAVQKA